MLIVKLLVLEGTEIFFIPVSKESKKQTHYNSFYYKNHHIKYCALCIAITYDKCAGLTTNKIILNINKPLL